MMSVRKLKKRLYDLNQKIDVLEQRVTKLIKKAESKNENPKVKVNPIDIIFSWEFVHFTISIARLVIDLLN
jgi:hypothetical protein